MSLGRGGKCRFYLCWRGDFSDLKGPESWCRAKMSKSVENCENFRPLQGSFGPFGPKVGKGVRNQFPGPFGPGAQKVENRVEKESKSTVFQLF